MPCGPFLSFSFLIWIVSEETMCAKVLILKEVLHGWPWAQLCSPVEPNSPRFSVPQSSLRSLQNLSVDISLEWYMENWFPSEPHSLWELTPGTWPGRFNSAVIGSDHTSTWPNGNLRKMFMATWTSKSRPTPEVAQDLVQSGGSRGRWPQCGPIVSYKPSIWAILPFHVTQASLPSGSFGA